MSTDNITAIEDIAGDSIEHDDMLPKVDWKNSVTVDPEHLREQRIILHGNDEESMIAISAFKSLRTHMLREMERRSVNSLMVTGATKGVGKSVIAINLAINIARHQEKHVLLVDLDLRSPSIASLIGFSPKLGIDNVNGNRFHFHQAVVYPNIEHLSILPCVNGHQNSTEILLSRQMRALLRLLQRRDDRHVVIFDAPPILGCDDVAAVSAFIDLSLVVVGEGENSRRELRQAMSILGETPVAGIVLNKSSKEFFKRYYY